MSSKDQTRADAAIDAYNDLRQSGAGNKVNFTYLDGRRYEIFGYKSDPSTGFHATAYLNRDTNDIIIAYRGTDPDLLHHTRTTVSDAIADLTMVRDRVNPQKAAADSFTREMLDKAQQQGISKDHITVSGHSLGGALAQIEAAEFGLRGATFNAYGAVSLSHHVPEGGRQVTNYVMAGDPVSAASRHYGMVVILASAEDVQSLRTGGYLGASPGAAPPNPLRAMRLGDHSGTHFTGPQSVLEPARLAQHQQQYAHNKAAFDQFHLDVHRDREALSAALQQVTAQALQARAEHAYDAAKHSVSRDIDAVEHTAGQAYDTLTHPGQLFQHSAQAASISPTATHADTSSSSSSAAGSVPPPVMDRHTSMQEDHAAQQHHERIQQAPQHAPQLAQAHSQTHAPTSHDNALAPQKPASVDMQEQERIAQLQQQEQQAQAAREQQHRLAQQHAQLHRQAMDAQQHEREQRHSQDTRSHQHEQRQAAESMLHTPPVAHAPQLPLMTAHPLEPGDRSVAVQSLQQHLQSIGATDHDGKAIQDDKDYGPRTQQAVENFQRWAGREPTGIADPGTLEALHTHAQFATRQKTQDLATDRHLAGQAKPAPSHLTDAVAERSNPPRPDLATAQQQAAPKALEPYSSPNSPLHALYAQTKTTMEGRGISVSEERMHQLVGKMALQGMNTGGKNDFVVKGDTLYGRNLDVPYNHFMLDMSEPAPSVQSTLQHVQTQLQTQEAELTAMRQQQQQHQYEHPYVR
ncbi:peptidoglycan-binding protein [Xanthomonas sp. GPE 39]|uniref:peptidoglycan-binding protein n=1 Tax=Xanthomonas sp. GPE 39 TaxID=1583099 RepID=UPI0009E4EF3C|nr:peptidoglycan-binding protein [Xanthomonas sp. GPE 39]